VVNLKTVFAVFALSALGLAGPVNIALVYSDSFYESDVYNKLNATGDFNITQINAEGVTPTVAQLQNYAAVLVWSNNLFLDRTALGNNLDAYLNGGGGVVVSVFANTNPSCCSGLLGNFTNDLGITEVADTSGVDLTLGTIHVPGSPLLNGVTSFDGGIDSFNDPGTLVAGFTDVADWSNGVPLVVTGHIGSGTTVDLNFYPGSSDAQSGFWLSNTNGTQLMADALLYSAGATGTATPEPASSVLAGTALAACVALRRFAARSAN
jgi:hypothetical protein